MIFSRDFVVSPVSRHFSYSRDFVVSPVPLLGRAGRLESDDGEYSDLLSMVGVVVMVM